MPPKSVTNPYKILGLEKNCTDKEIQKAYRGQCLKWHPDKNLDNKEEAERRFIEAKEAFEFLYDKQKRAEYDESTEKVRVAQENYSKRMAEADSNRRKLIEELRQRETEFNGKRSVDGSSPMTEAQRAKKMKTDHRNFKEEIEAVRRKLEKEVNEEVKQKSTMIKAEKEKLRKSSEITMPQLLIKWRTIEGLDYSEDDIRSLFSRYGPISSISSAIPKKDRRKRIVEYEPGTNAWGAELETGTNPMPELTGKWIQPPVSLLNNPEKHVTASRENCNNLEHMSLDDLEAQIMGGF